jgi:hypothetical protein
MATDNTDNTEPREFTEYQPIRMWKRLPVERRQVLAESFWGDEQSTEQQAEAIAAIAARMKFRTKSVLGLSLEKRVRYLATLPAISDSIVARALVAYHLEHQRPMMSAFLDLLEIKHEDGLIAEDSAPKPEADALKKAAAELATKYPADDVTLYFATLISQDPETWGALADSSLVEAR